MSDQSDFYSLSDPENIAGIRPYDAFESNPLASDKKSFSFIDSLLGSKTKQAEEVVAEEEVLEDNGSLPLLEEQDVEQELTKEEKQIQDAEQALQEAQQLHAQAQAALNDAQEQALKIIDQANHKGEEFEAQAYQDGFSQGEAAGKKLTEQKVESVIRNLDKIVKSADESRKGLMDNSQRELCGWPT